MRLTPEPLAHLTHKKGYKDHDIFNTSTVRQRLSNLVSDLEGHGVLVLDGPWGSGKTTFARMWEHQLKANGHRVVWIDAFELDPHDDAFLPLMLQIKRLFEPQDSQGPDSPNPDSEDPRLSNLLAIAEDIYPLMRSVSVGVPLIGRINLGLAMEGAIMLAAKVKNAAKRNREPEAKYKMTLSSTSKERDNIRIDSSEANMEFSARLARTADIHNAIHRFKDEMKIVVDHLTQSPDIKRPLVFIIDELDRCTPRFALNVLERMKHLFSIDGVCFILVTHLTELGAMVAHEYGLDDPVRYLDKFYHVSIDIDQVLEAQNTGAKDSARVKYKDKILNLLEGQLPITDDRFTFTLTNLIDTHRPSLRSVERIVINLGLYQTTGRCSGSKRLTHFAAALCVMRIVSNDLYQSAAAGKLTFEEAKEFLRIDEWRTPPDDDGNFLDDIEAWWWLVTVSDEGHERFGAVQRGIARIESRYDEAISRNDSLVGLSPTKLLRRICVDLSLFAKP